MVQDVKRGRKIFFRATIKIKLKRFITICISILSATAFSWGRSQSRNVQTDTICNAPIAELRAIADRFAYEFQASPDALFEWAFKGTGDSNSGKGKDANMLRYKERTYDAKKRTGDVALDIYVLGAKMFRDNHLTTVYQPKELLKNGEKQSRIYATYSGSLLEGGEMIFRFDSIAPNKTAAHFEFNITFGKFFSSFISDKTWQQVAVWRIKTIFGNIKEFAETGKVEDKKRK